MILRTATLALALVPPAVAQSRFLAPVDLLDGQPGVGDVQLADLDGDGLADLVVGGRRVAVRLSLGGGAFGPWRPVTAFPEPMVHVLVTDLDGDGLEDLLAVRAGFPEAHVEWARGDGHGSFAPVVDTLAVESFRVWRAPMLADLDGDGDPDLVLQATGMGTIDLSWIENDAGTFSGAADPIVLQGPTSSIPPGAAIDLRDVDGDGLVDLVVRPAANDSLEIHRGAGGGVLEAPLKVVDSGSDIRQGQLLDWDADGDLDALTGTASSGFLLSEAVAPLTFLPPRPAGLEASFPITTMPAAVDVDGDGRVDVRAMSGRDPFVWRQVSPGTFTAPLPETADDRLDPLDLSGGDVDGDGRPEGLQRSAYLHEATLYFSNPAPSGPLLGRPRSLASAAQALSGPSALVDVDGDGHDDLVAFLEDGTGVYLRRRPGGAFEAAVRVDHGPYLLRKRAAVAGDLDGDGHQDIALIEEGSQGAKVYRGDGAGNFGIWQTLEGPSYGPTELEVEDLDGDGQDELMLVWDGVGRLHRLDPVLGTPTTIAEADTRCATLADLDGDGQTDWILGRGSEVLWRRGLVGGGFAPEALLVGAFTPQQVRCSDVDGDGSMDLLIRFGPRVQVSLQWPLVPPLFADPVTAVSLGDPGVAWTVEPADLDGDGLDDLIALGRSSSVLPEIRVAPNLGGHFGLPTSPPDGDRQQTALAITDVDDDGDLDLVGSASGRLLLRRNTALGGVGSVSCDPGAVSSVGSPARLRAFGEVQVASQSLALLADGLPAGRLALLAGATASSPPTPVPGAVGDLCLAGGIGRFLRVSRLIAADGSGAAEIPLDPTALAASQGYVPALAGDSWTFQAWFRDETPAGPAGHFTSAVTLQF